MLRVGFLYSKIRQDEKLLLEEMRKRNLEIVKIDDKELNLSLEKQDFGIDILLERSVSHSRALYALKFFQSYGIPTINTFDVATVCGDKAYTSLALENHGILTPKTRVALTEETAIQAMEELGWPCVIKPVTGSWARMCAKLNDKDAAEAVLEHKKVLGEYMHSIFYIQEYIEKPGRDIRAFVVGDETIAAIYRESEHWITNTSRGAIARNCEITEELNEICLKTAEAVGGGVLAMDVFEGKEGLMMNEVNYTMEFKNSVEPTGVDIPKKVIDYVVETARK